MQEGGEVRSEWRRRWRGEEGGMRRQTNGIKKEREKKREGEKSEERRWRRKSLRGRDSN